MQEFFYMETYGCSANQNNSEIIAGLLKSSGYNLTNNFNIAQIIIISSCVVKGKTESKIKRRIQDIKDSGKLIIIFGCLPQTNAKEIKKLNRNALLLGTHHVTEIPKLIKDYNENKLDDKKQESYICFRKEEKLNLPKIPINPLISITQISEGCMGCCSYCKTCLAKGKLFSYDMEAIAKSIESDLKNGAKEVWLTSQDCASYGIDSEDKTPKLPILLNKILSLPHKFKLRLGMMDPNNVLPILNELVEVYKNPKMYKFLHMPIQSTSNKILKDMNRLYKIEDAKSIINQFRKEFPDIVLATDIIIGYPTSTKEDFKEDLNFINEYKPDVFNLSKISIHKGTAIEKLKPLPVPIINKQTSSMMEAHRKTALENKKRYLDKEIKVFVDKKMPGGIYESRDENYNIVLINSNENILGKTLNVKIKQAGVHHMIGEIT
jgi:threonylcarbamoyladenosine tRNA methylthiotransferase CDKAL1